MLKSSEHKQKQTMQPHSKSEVSFDVEIITVLVKFIIE